MKDVNCFDARLVDGDDKSIQFSILIPSDDPGPSSLCPVLEMILRDSVRYYGHSVETDYFDLEVEDDA